MAGLDFGKLNTALGVEAIDCSMVNLVFQLKVSKAQADKGILGKVIIFHPAFTTRATLFASPNGAVRVSASSMKTGENAWFNIVTLEAGFRNHIIAEYQKEIAGTREGEAWYLKMLGSHNKEVTADAVNESLDIKNIVVMTSLSEKQMQANMLCKVNIVTSVATLRSYSVYKSQFGQQLYGNEQNEDADNTIPAYTLSRECEAQILNLIHPVVTEWNVTFEKKVVEPVVTTHAIGTGAVVVMDGEVVPFGAVPEFDPALYQ